MFEKRKSKFAILQFMMILLIIGCTPSAVEHENPEIEHNDSLAVQIVNKSIRAHGGMQNWLRTKAVSYKKTIIFFDSIGNKESRTVQFHHYQLNPDLSGQISWTTAHDSISIFYKDNRGVKFINGIVQTDPKDSASARAIMLSSYFVLFQPWKLMDSEVNLEYLGRFELEDGQLVEGIKATFGEYNRGDDRWWFYFDVNSDRLVANMVNHLDHYSFIKNLEYDTTSALVFNRYRKSFFVDSLRHIDYLRAEYYYEDFDLELANQ